MMRNCHILFFPIIILALFTCIASSQESVQSDETLTNAVIAGESAVQEAVVPLEANAEEIPVLEPDMEEPAEQLTEILAENELQNSDSVEQPPSELSQEPVATPADAPTPPEAVTENAVEPIAETIEEAAPPSVPEQAAETPSEPAADQPQAEETIQSPPPEPKVIAGPVPATVMRSANVPIVGTKDSSLTGKAALTDTPEGLLVVVKVEGFPSGNHGIHFHENPSCDGEGEAAGGHFNPDGTKHGFLPNNGLSGAHAGDLGNLMVRRDGRGDLRIILPGVTVMEGKYAVNNRSIIIHEKEDDFGQPTGNAGGRIACGVVKTN